MFNAGRGHALGRGRGRGLGHPPPPMYALGAPPPFPPPYAIPAGAFQQRNHDGERVNGSKVPNFRDLADNATLSEREHWLDHVFTELAACGSVGCAAGGHTFINNRIFIFALERMVEDVNFHLFAPILGSGRDRVWYKKRLPGGPRGLVGGQPCPAFISKRAS